MAHPEPPVIHEPDWRRILDAVNDCVWSAAVDADGAWHYLYVSPAIERITGWPADFFRASRQRWLDVIHSEDQSRVIASDKALPFAQRDARDAEYTYRMIRRDGSTCWVRDVVRVTPGEPTRLDGVFADVTGQQHAELALRVSEDRMRRVIDANPDAVVLIDAQRRITLANPAAARLFGRRGNALIGLTWEQLGIEQEPPDAEKSVLHGQQYSLFRPDGTRARVLMNLATLPSGDGEFAGFVATFDDVTALAAATEQLARSEARARVLLEQMPAIIWSIDRDLRVSSMQGKALADISLVPDQLIGVLLPDYLQTSPSRHITLDACQRALAGESAHYESVHENRTFATYIEPLRDDAGTVTGAVGVSLDITHLREPADATIRQNN